MAGCSGPYTRVFFEEKDAARCETLADRLKGAGLVIDDARLPPGDAGLDDLACDLYFHHPERPDEAWVLRLAKFLGPKRLLRYTHVYEATLQRPSASEAEAFQGHLYADDLSRLGKTVLAAWPVLREGGTVDGLVAKEDSHVMRITLCNE